MAYTITAKGYPKKTCNSIRELRTTEAFFKGMRTNYSINYNDTIMSVKFETNQIDIKELDIKIDLVKKQMTILDNNPKPDDAEFIKLQNYYKNKLASYESRKKALIDEIEVHSETIKTN